MSRREITASVATGVLPARLFPAALLTTALLTTACGGESATPADAVATWRVDSVPQLTLGRDAGAADEVVFERITGATQLPDGSLLVADLGDAPLRLFGSDGALLRRVARKGGGPGEMEYLARLFRCGDAIYTYDIDGYRISEYSTDATYKRTFRFEVPATQTVPYVSACNAAGRFAHLGWGARGVPKAGYHRDTVPVWVTAAVDGAPTIVDSVAASERWGQTSQGRIVGSRPLPLGKQPSVAAGPRGFYVATGDAYAVLAYDGSGALRDTLTLADSVPAVTQADIRDLIEAEIAEDGERNRAAIERSYAEITFPERHGAISALLVDAEGLLWLRTYAAPSATTATWRVMDDTGREVARIGLPRRLEVFEIGRDYVLGRQLDTAQGVPVLQRWRLDRSAQRPGNASR